MFGHDLSNTRDQTAETAIGPGNVDTLVEKWRWGKEGSNVGSAVTGTPIVVDGVVYFGTWQGQVVALDAATGTQVWKKGPPNALTIDSTPCVTDTQVFVGDGAGHVHALDRATGDVQWTTPIDPDLPEVHMYSSPVYIPSASLVVIGVASIEVALPGVTDYMFTGSVVALDASSGDIVWQTYMTHDDMTSGPGVSVWSTAAIDESRHMLFIGTGQTYQPPAGELADALVAIDYETGDVVWHRQFTADDLFTIFGDFMGPDFDVGASPNLFQIEDDQGNLVDVVGVADKAGVYSVLDRDTGQTVHWAEQLGEGTHLGGVMATSAYHDGSLYTATNHWTDLGDFSSLNNGATMFRRNAATGAEEWSVDLPAPVVGGITYANGVVYVTTVIGTAHGLDAETGDELWMKDGFENVGGGISVANGLVYVPHGFTFFALPGNNSPGGLVVYGLP